MQPWQVVGLFCEDVRQEKQGYSLIGILPDNVNVPSIPGMFPKLGLYVRLNVDPAADVGPISLRLRLPDGTESDLTGFDAEFVKETQKEAASKGAPWAGFIVTAVSSPLSIAKAGRIIALASIMGEEMICAGLNVQEGQAPA